MAEENGQMVKLEDAVRHAAEYLRQIYPTAEQGRVEEVERSDDDNYWLITLGFLLPEGETRLPSPPMVPDVLRRIKRLYKIFKIDRRSGEVVSMKIREPLHV